MEKKTMSFKINIPKGAKLGSVKPYKDAKADLHMQHLSKVASAPPRDEYAFGQKVALSAFNITKQFKNVLRQLSETCKANTGKALMTDADIEQL